MAQSPDALDLPRPFGAHTLLRRIAVGGMAEVYVAKAKGIGGFEKLVAIKVIHPRFGEDDHFIQMLVEEAKISVLLNHMNIGQIFDLGCIDETYFIVMEYIEGADAYRILKRAAAEEVKLPLDVCAYIAAEVANGLDYAHRKKDSTGKPLGIVHRDISPQNVLISYIGEVKIVDFGIAKAALRTAQTDAGVIKGKYYYMSPEQAWGDPTDHRSDIFSAGIVLYELLTGEMLYQEDNIPSLLDAVRKAEVEPPSQHRHEVPAELSAIVMKALAKRPEDRYQSAHQMGQDLTQFVYATSPTFTAQRLADVMVKLFADELGPEVLQAQPTSGERVLTDAPSSHRTNDESNLEVMAPKEFAPDRTKSIIFDASAIEDATRNDILPYRSQPVQPPVLDPPAPLPGLHQDIADEEEDVDDETLIHDRDGVDDARAGGDWDQPTIADDPDEWDDATQVDPDGRIMERAQELYGARGHPAIPVAPPKQSHPISAAPPAGRSRSKIPPPPPPPPSALRSRIPPPPPPRPSAPVPAPSPWPSTRPTSQATDTSTESRSASWPSIEPLPIASTMVTTPAKAIGFTDPHAEPTVPRGSLRPDTATDVGPPPLGDPFVAQPDPVAVSAGFPRGRAPRVSRWLIVALGATVGLGVIGFVASALFFSESAPEPVVTISSVPSGAEVTLDGRVVGRTPMTLSDGLVVGQSREVQLSLPGFEAERLTVTPVSGELQLPTILRPLRAALLVETEPDGAHVWVDGVLHGSAPLTVAGLPMGRRIQVRAAKVGFVEAQTELTIDPSDLSPVVRLTLEEQPEEPR